MQKGILISVIFISLLVTAFASLKDLSAQPHNSTAMDSCQAQISALTFSDPGVQGAYNPASPRPYSGVLNLIPQSGGCPQVY